VEIEGAFALFLFVVYAPYRPQTYRLYLKGREFLVGTDAEMDKSVNFFKQALARAPDYAMAYAGLADVHSVQALLGAGSQALLQKLGLPD
jgi:hypothetical protein